MAGNNEIKATEAAQKAYATAAAEAPLAITGQVPVSPAPAAEPIEAEVVASPAAAPAASVKGEGPTKGETRAQPKKKAVKPAVVTKARAVSAAKARPGTTANTKSGRKADQPAAPARVRQPDTQRKPEPTLSELKEKIMATTAKKTTDYTKFIQDVQGKAQEAFAKSGAFAGEAGEFTKGNVEALVESGRVLANGVQAISQEYAAESKAAFETLTADIKELAAVKSPTELFQVQGKLARRNLDTAVAFGAKTSESLLKLANEVFTPLSNRVSIAVEKVSKAA